jgi:hypothetical protein
VGFAFSALTPLSGIVLNARLAGGATPTPLTACPKVTELEKARPHPGGYAHSHFALSGAVLSASFAGGAHSHKSHRERILHLFGVSQRQN